MSPARPALWLEWIPVLFYRINVGRSCWRLLLAAIFTAARNLPKLRDTFEGCECRRGRT